MGERRLSFLTDFEDVDSYLDWEVGVHGVHISFAPPTPSSSTPSPLASPPPGARKPSYSATYLPNVAPEQGWDNIETIDSAIRKAGWEGAITEDLRRSIKVRRYQSRKCTVGWDEYEQWRTSRGGQM